MHGLVNRSVQGFVVDTYGAPSWQAVLDRAKLPVTEFDTLAVYDDALTEALVAAGCAVLNKLRAVFLEDLGTYLVANPQVDRLRRLLRYSGTSFSEFLLALEDVPDRARLAFPDLALPHLRLEQVSGTCFRLTVISPFAGAAHVVAGILRAMADDYGALVMLDIARQDGGHEVIEITVHELDFAVGRSFDLAGGMA